MVGRVLPLLLEPVVGAEPLPSLLRVVHDLEPIPTRGGISGGDRLKTDLITPGGEVNGSGWP
jgi:hypothetical protein